MKQIVVALASTAILAGACDREESTPITNGQGEIAGEYFLSNSNLKTHMLRLHTTPRDDIGTGLIFFDYKLDQPGSYQDGVVSDELGQEVNWYMDWKFHDDGRTYHHYDDVFHVVACTEISAS